MIDMEFRAFIGIDTSKETLDFSLLKDGKKEFHRQTSNTKKGISAFYSYLKKQGFDPSTCLFCMEHTGIYCNPFLNFTQEKELSLWLEDATRIKSFHGTEREKNDKVDSLRIAEYAYSKYHNCRLWEAPREVIVQLKSLLSIRERLIKSKQSFSVALNEENGFVDSSSAWRKHKSIVNPLIKELKKSLKEIESEMKKLVGQDQTIKRLYELISSVKGVGLITAINTLVVTNEFKLINSSKKMACHCGVVPFVQQSGKSVRSKSRVSHRANKRMKTLLNMGARSAIKTPGELRDYYLRKVGEGKNKMTVLNAVRNKIIHRMFACVRDNRKYEYSYQHHLA